MTSLQIRLATSTFLLKGFLVLQEKVVKELSSLHHFCIKFPTLWKILERDLVWISIFLFLWRFSPLADVRRGLKHETSRQLSVSGYTPLSIIKISWVNIVLHFSLWHRGGHSFFAIRRRKHATSKKVGSLVN